MLVWAHAHTHMHAHTDDSTTLLFQFPIQITLTLPVQFLESYQILGEPLIDISILSPKN